MLLHLLLLVATVLTATTGDATGSAADTTSCAATSEASGRAALRRVAIVGAGIAGATSASTLHQLFAHEGTPLAVDVFEARAVAGGRMRDVVIGGTRVEVGASVFHAVNQKMMNASLALNLTARKNPHLAGATLGVWDGLRFCYWETGWGILDKLRAVWRFGLGLLRIGREVDDMMPAFQTAYAKLQRGEGSPTPGHMFASLAPLLDVSIGHYLGQETLMGGTDNRTLHAAG